MIDVIIGEEVSDGDVIGSAPDVRLFAEEAEAAHGDEDGVHVDAPEVEEEDHLQFDVRLLGDAHLGADVGVVAVPEEERVAAGEHLAEPAQNVRVVDDLVLDEFLRDAEEHLGAHVPKSVDGRFRVPHFNLFRLVEDEEGVHGLLGHVRHVGLMDEGDETVDELQGGALDLVPGLALILFII